MLEQINKDATRVGGVWVKLNRKEHGTLKGIVLEMEEREKTFKGAPVLSRTTGKPRKSRVFTLLTEDRDADIEDDHGVRRFDANERAYMAIVDAVKECGKGAEKGDTLEIKVVEDPPNDQSQATYKARWTKGPGVPAEFTAAASDLVDDEDDF